MKPPSADERQPAYLRLANLLESMIASQSLRPGDRAPSLRQFSAQQRVSLPTALQAYSVLETRGLLEARPKSGFFVRSRLAESVPAPQTPRLLKKTASFADTDPLDALMEDRVSVTLAPLGAAMPGPELLPGLKLARALNAVAKKIGAEGTAYDEPGGAEVLRIEIARRSLEWGGALKPNDVVITVGATEALLLALRATCRRGDNVIVESPTYFGLARMICDLGLRAIPIPVDSANGIHVDALERAARRQRVAACVLMPNFHNPVGSLLSEERKKHIVDTLLRRDIAIIEDDVFGDLQHEGLRPRCLKTFDPDDRIILCGSYSKTLAPGYRVGFIAPGRRLKNVLDLKRTTSLSGPLLLNLAVAEFLKNGGYDRYLRHVRQAYREQVARMREAIVESFPKNICLSRPRGGFLLWCELPPSIDSIALFHQARAAGISVAPGPLFSATGGFKNFIRINCGHPWDARMERAIGILGHLTDQLAKQKE